ncbi:hypothetical protein GGR57DRAFT_308393 [Xylariaceae sp. FL1272]|nr:hypothetical protein GGR57DRAFT_308393 [Xylariaceae sp. FL1272]
MSASGQNPNKSLSAAAAGAALRARPHTPTNVAEVQTKRNARRSASVSSNGSAAMRSGGPARLERRASSGSMTERTFRSPSPGRSTAPVREPEPPVPQIPANHRNSTANVRKAGGGIGMQTFRTASQKLKTEPTSYYTQPAVDLSNVRTSDAPMRGASGTQHAPSPPSERSDSRSSVNFSYPTAFRPQSPPTSPTSHRSPYRDVISPHSTTRSSRGHTYSSKGSQELVYDPNSRRMVPKYQIESVADHDTRRPTPNPAKTKKKDGGLQREGSQLAKGTMTRPRGTMLEDEKPHYEPSSRELPVISPVLAAEEHPLLEEPVVKALITPVAADRTDSIQLTKSQHKARSPEPATEPSDEVLQPKPMRSSKAGPQVESDLRAESDEESEMETPRPTQSVMGALDAVPTRQTRFEDTRSPSPAAIEQHNFAVPEPEPRKFSLARNEVPEQAPGKQKAVFVENKPVAEIVRTSGSWSRSPSNSPVRQARFSSSPAENLAVRHVPLPRSASPIKSALKHSSPAPREVSPSVDNASDPSGSSGASPDSTMLRKKSVRVSFDDQNTVVVGDGAPVADTNSPVVPSPQSAKRTWFSNIGRNKKKDLVLEEDEVMKPRPALPSFGSVREKKSREPEERPLVRPLELSPSPAAPSSPELRPESSSTMNESEIVEDPNLGQSSDQAIGSVLAQEHGSRIPANISRFREPLPPVVTSVEGSGYHSDSLQSSDSENEDANSPATASATLSTQTTELTQPDEPESSMNGSIRLTVIEEQQPLKQTESRAIPQISVILPSPMSPETQAEEPTSAQYFEVPGGFPESEPEFKSDQKTSTTNSSENGSPTDAIFEAPATVLPVQTGTLPQTTLATTVPVQASDDVAADDSEESSVYSDAYEDIPDGDGSGFQSLDAIVESPVVAASKPRELSQKSPEPQSPTRGSGSTSPPPPRDSNDWEQAKAFWRSLTTEKRRQLELEAIEDAGAEGDREEVSIPVRRNSSKRKSTGQKPSIAETAPSVDIATKAKQLAREMASQQAAAPKVKTNPKVESIPKPEPKIRHEPVAARQTHMRRSMRDEQPARPVAAQAQPQTGMRKTMRANGSAQGSARPASTIDSSLSAPQKAAASQAARARPQSAVLPSNSMPPKQTKPALQRRGSDASDSSFTRTRLAPSGGFSFRKSMRATSPPETRPEATKGSGRFSLRSSSPASSTARRNSTFSSPPTSGMMRRSLRSNSDSSHEAKRSSLHLPSFGKSGKAPAGRQSSRLGDSSDEDERPALGFRSRFNDSSDEEDHRPSSSRENKTLARGSLRGSAPAPNTRRPAAMPDLEEDSSELPDSDDNKDNDNTMPSPMQSPQSRFTAGRPAAIPRTSSGAIGTSSLARSGNGLGGITPSYTDPGLGKPRERKGSFLGILRRNKNDPGKIKRSELTESAARRDTKLERDPGQLKDLRSDVAMSPKLQKRNPFDANGARPSSAGNAFGRSNTSNTIERPNMSGRRSVSLGQQLEMAGGDAENVIPETPNNPGAQKKKKFGALRRMFKLDE